MSVTEDKQMDRKDTSQYKVSVTQANMVGA